MAVHMTEDEYNAMVGNEFGEPTRDVRTTTTKKFKGGVSKPISKPISDSLRDLGIKNVGTPEKAVREVLPNVPMKKRTNVDKLKGAAAQIFTPPQQQSKYAERRERLSSMRGTRGSQRSAAEPQQQMWNPVQYDDTGGWLPTIGSTFIGAGMRRYNGIYTMGGTLPYIGSSVYDQGIDRQGSTLYLMMDAVRRQGSSFAVQGSTLGGMMSSMGAQGRHVNGHEIYTQGRTPQGYSWGVQGSTFGVQGSTLRGLYNNRQYNKTKGKGRRKR